MKNIRLRLAFIALFSVMALAQASSAKISARSAEVLQSYDQATDFVEGLSVLKPRLQAICKNLLDVQLRMHNETDSWKMYSLYEMFQEQRLMTGKLLRVSTVTELSGSIPQYTNYRIVKPAVSLDSFSRLKSGALIVVDKGTQCGPDPLSVEKGASFLKCGDYLIGSGLIRADQLKPSQCLNIRVLINADI